MSEISNVANDVVKLADNLAMMLDEKGISFDYYAQAETVLDEAQKLRQMIENADE